MMKQSKYVGETYGVFWRAESCYKKTPGGCSFYTLRNTRSGMEAEVDGSQMLRIAEGTLTVSSLLHSRIVRKGGGII